MSRAPFDPVRGLLRGASWVLVAPGLVLIAVGVLVWVVPDLLRAMVAMAFLFVGAILVTAGWRSRRTGRRSRGGADDFWDPSDDIRDGTPRW